MARHPRPRTGLSIGKSIRKPDGSSLAAGSAMPGLARGAFSRNRPRISHVAPHGKPHSATARRQSQKAERARYGTDVDEKIQRNFAINSAFLCDVVCLTEEERKD
jgi:hypothetical protein